MIRVLKRSPEFILVPVFCIIYIFSLTFLYVEGDDAYSVMYHALGRNPAIERSYGPYQAMMDVWLSILPANETVVRMVAISLHAVFGFIFPILIIKLLRSYRLVSRDAWRPLLVFCLLLPFAFPELIFFGLYYQCSTIALSLILIAHLILRNSLLHNLPHHPLRFVLAILICAIGTCLRWDTGFYLLVILTDILLLRTANFRQKEKIVSSFGLAALIGFASLAAVIGFIYLEGYSLSRIIELFSYSQHGRLDVAPETSWKINIGSSISLFTPFFVITFLVGLVVAIRSRKYFLLLLLALSYLHVWKLYPVEFLNPRRVINSIPYLLIFCFIGFQYLYTLGKARKLALSLVIIFCFIPWVVGVKIYSDDTMWGPGFGIKEQVAVIDTNTAQLEKVDERVEIGHIGLTFLKGGFAVPFEGPRPVWGYFGVIFGGEWRKLLQVLNDERDNLLAKAIRDDLPIVQQDFGVNAMVNLVRDGYTTKDKLTGILVNDSLSMRRFYKDTDTVVFIFPNSNGHLSVADPAYIKDCSRTMGQDSLYLYIYSTSLLHNLKSASPHQIYTYGPATGLAVME